MRSEASRARHSSNIVLSQAALKKNIRFIRQRVGEHPVISSVVKANAYGHGIDTFVPMAEKAGIHHFSVASGHEAEEVLDACAPESRVMIMGILYDQDLPWVIDHGVEFYVYALSTLEKVIAVARERGKPARVHLEVETGCNRTGFSPDGFGKALTLLKRHGKQLEFAGLCTHMAGAESLSNNFRIQRQMERFEEFKKIVSKRKLKPERFHVGCSAAVLAYPEYSMDMVRVGTLQYGFWPGPDMRNLWEMNHRKTKKESPLARIMTWKTDVMDLKDVAKDEFIGYGTAYQAYQDMRIAVMPLGYSNGYPRGLSNKGQVLIRGRKAPIVGLINMNVFMVDVSHIPDCAIGDEVVLVGRQGKNSISVRSFSEFANQLNNEMISRLPTAIPRKVAR